MEDNSGNLDGTLSIPRTSNKHMPTRSHTCRDQKNHHPRSPTYRYHRTHPKKQKIKVPYQIYEFLKNLPESETYKKYRSASVFISATAEYF